MGHTPHKKGKLSTTSKLILVIWQRLFLNDKPLTVQCLLEACLSSEPRLYSNRCDNSTQIPMSGGSFAMPCTPVAVQVWHCRARTCVDQVIAKPVIKCGLGHGKRSHQELLYKCAWFWKLNTFMIYRLFIIQRDIFFKCSHLYLISRPWRQSPSYKVKHANHHVLTTMCYW